MDAKSRAIEAIVAVTTEGPVRERAIAAVAQLNTQGTAFRIYLTGSKRQSDATLRALKEAGVIATVTRAKPGAKATYVTTEEFRDEVAVQKQDAHPEGAPIPFESFFDAYSDLVDQLYPTLDELQESWKLPVQQRYEGLAAAALVEGIETEGKKGDAVDTVLWTLSLMEDGVTIEDFSLEGRFHTYSIRTLREALADLKAVGIVRVKLVPNGMAIYSANPEA